MIFVKHFFENHFQRITLILICKLILHVMIVQNFKINGFTDDRSGRLCRSIDLNFINNNLF